MLSHEKFIEFNLCDISIAETTLQYDGVLPPLGSWHICIITRDTNNHTQTHTDMIIFDTKDAERMSRQTRAHARTHIYKTLTTQTTYTTHITTHNTTQHTIQHNTRQHNTTHRNTHNTHTITHTHTHTRTHAHMDTHTHTHTHTNTRTHTHTHSLKKVRAKIGSNFIAAQISLLYAVTFGAQEEQKFFWLEFLISGKISWNLTRLVSAQILGNLC